MTQHDIMLNSHMPHSVRKQNKWEVENLIFVPVLTYLLLSGKQA